MNKKIQKSTQTPRPLKPKDDPDSMVYIGNLSYQRDEIGIKALFTEFGRVKYLKIVVEPSTNKSKGYAFVKMLSPQEATHAIKNLNGKIVDGRKLKASRAIEQKKLKLKVPQRQRSTRK